MSKKDKQNNRVSNAVVGALLVISLCLIAFDVKSDEVFKFKNPSFSGIGTGAHYLTIENQEFSRTKAIKDAMEAARKSTGISIFLLYRVTHILGKNLPLTTVPAL